MIGTHLVCVAFCVAATLGIDPPTVDSLDFDSMPIAAPDLEHVETVLAAVEGKAPPMEAVERVWLHLASQATVDLADVTRLAANRARRKKLDEVYQEILGRPATIVEVMEWAGEMRPLAGAGVYGGRLRRLAKHKERRLEGVVVDPDGNPAHGALVRNWTSGWFAKSDASGKFAFESFSPKEFSVVAVAEKGDLFGRLYPIGPTSDAGPIEIRMAKMKRVGVTVKDPDGKPIRNAAVTVSGSGANPANFENGYWWQSIAHTDADGKAEVGRLLDGDQISATSARHRGYAPMASGEGRDGPLSYELTLQRGVEVRCRIVGPDDQPLDGASVKLRKSGDNTSPRAHIADGGGKYSIVVAPGTYAVVAEHPDFAMAKTEVVAEVDKPLDEVVLKLSAGEFIEGRVEQNGEPVAYTDVGWLTVQAPAGAGSRDRPIGPGNFTATSGQGEFRIGPLPKGATYTVMAAEPEGRRLYRSKPAEAGAKGVTIVLKN